MKNGNKYIKIFLYVFIVVLCFGYLRYKSTYASYETNVKGNINPQIADWKILVNGVEATTSDDVLELDSRSFKWDCPSSGVREQKVGPGCYGVMHLNVDASNTEVAVLYEFDIKDKSVAPEKILKITDIQFSNTNFYKTDVSKYSGYLSLDDIKNNPQLSIRIEVIWEDVGDIVYDEEFFTNDDNYITIDFFAKQYLGEEIVPYNG